ncbi:MAG TPA: ornithine cyclodeaminase family protein [Puia sp.]|nr:ornithine cyclodeaminase family protein [Puia sp.]
MEPLYINNEKIKSLLPMDACITAMETMFRDLAEGRILQPLRSLMWLPDRSGLLGMMPGYAEGPNIIGVKLITIFHSNGTAGIPSHQGVVILFEATHGKPLLLLDAAELTAIRTAATSALATRLLAREDSTTLAIIGTGEQAIKHIESISLVRPIETIYCWGRNPAHAKALRDRLAAYPHQNPASGRPRYSIQLTDTAQAAARSADIICTVTAAAHPVLEGRWLQPGTHLNVVGSCTPHNREVDTETILRSALFTDRYESLFKEAGDFLIPKVEGLITESDVKAEIGEVLTGKKPGRQNPADITLFKSLGIAAEDLYAAWHIYQALLPAR